MKCLPVAAASVSTVVQRNVFVRSFDVVDSVTQDSPKIVMIKRLPLYVSDDRTYLSDERLELRDVTWKKVRRIKINVIGLFESTLWTFNSHASSIPFVA